MQALTFASQDYSAEALGHDAHAGAEAPLFAAQLSFLKGFLELPKTPTPLMSQAEAEINFTKASSWHSGQVVKAGALMDCILVKVWPQWEQRYS